MTRILVSPVHCINKSERGGLSLVTLERYPLEKWLLSLEEMQNVLWFAATFMMTLANLEGEESFDASMLGSAEEVVQERICDDELILIKGWVSSARSSRLYRAVSLLGHLQHSLGWACSWHSFGQVLAAALTTATWTRLKQKFDVIVAPKASSLCQTSRPQFLRCRQ